MVWWSQSGFKGSASLTLELTASCSEKTAGSPDGERLSVLLKGSQRTCEDSWQMNAVRYENSCPHVMVLELDRSTTINPWLTRSDLQGCALVSNPIDFEARTYRQSEDGSQVQDNVIDFLRLQFRVDVIAGPETNVPTAMYDVVVSGVDDGVEDASSPSSSTAAPSSGPFTAPTASSTAGPTNR